MTTTSKTIFFLLFILLSTGAVAQGKKPLHIFDLGQPITEDLVRNYPGCLVRAAWKVDTSNLVSYEVRLVKSKMEYGLIYNKDGKFLRKQAVSPVIAEVKPVIKRKPQKSFFMQQMDSMQISDSLILKY